VAAAGIANRTSSTARSHNLPAAARRRAQFQLGHQLIGIHAGRIEAGHNRGQARTLPGQFFLNARLLFRIRRGADNPLHILEVLEDLLNFFVMLIGDFMRHVVIGSPAKGLASLFSKEMAAGFYKSRGASRTDGSGANRKSGK
jgi:hypothetical protein